MVDGIFEIASEEAKIVKIIYEDFLNCIGKNAIMKKLVAGGIQTKGSGIGMKVLQIDFYITSILQKIAKIKLYFFWL